MKKIHLWLLVVMSIFVTTLTSNAEVHYRIVIGDLSYDLDDDYHTATVTPHESTAIETVIIPSYVSYKGQTYEVNMIEDMAFYEHYNLLSVTIPEGVKQIGSDCFGFCKNLTSVSLPEGLKQLSGGLFEHCYNLSSITIPKDVTVIPPFCFYACNLTSISFPEGLKKIAEYAFYACYSLTSISIPKNVTEIGDWCFGDCYNLTSLSLPEGLTKIGNGAFYDCYNLTSLSLPEGLDEIGDSAFFGCYKLNRVTANNPVPAIITNSSFPLDVDSKTEFLYVPKGSVEAYESSDWKYYFEKILEIDSAEVEEIGDCPTGINYSEPYEVFTLAGERVHADFDSLSPGIYIIRQGNLTEKLSVSN